MLRRRQRRTTAARAGGLALAVALLTIVLPTEAVDAGSARTCAQGQGRRSITGTLDGARFRVELPTRWNCTLVLYSHGYFPPAFDPGPGYQIGLANRPETERWLLEHGYALAASEFLGRTGAVFEQAITDQIAVVDWFDTHIGRPRRTVALGSSGGGALSVMLAERHPRRFAGVAALCAPLDISGQLNLYLDLMFAIRTLLVPPDQQVDLVRPRDPAASQDALTEAVGSATGSPEGLARLALANAVVNIQGWNSAVQPRPDSAVDQVMAQAAIDAEVIFLWGPVSRVDLEARAGGNPSWNTGVDYRRQLARSNQRHLVEQAYAAAGADADLDADLARLAAAPRIAADPAAQAWLTRFGVPQATTPSPVITLHNTADFAVPLAFTSYTPTQPLRPSP